MSMPNAHHELATTRYSLLKRRAQAFCSSLLEPSNNPATKLLDEHFTKDEARITDHGPRWASKRLLYIGQTFMGREGCLEYFDLQAKTLDFLPNQDTFRGGEGIVVDDKALVDPDGKHIGSGKGWDGRGVVNIVGKARCKAVRTGSSWDEEFIYRLSDFDEEGKIGHWELWRDTLSAWIAVGGESIGEEPRSPQREKVVEKAKAPQPEKAASSKKTTTDRKSTGDKKSKLPTR